MLALHLLLSLVYAVVFVCYFYIRAAYTLDIHWRWYGYLLLAAEFFWATGTLLFVFAKSSPFREKSRPAPAQQQQADEDEVSADRKYFLKVLIPCTDECIEVLETTVEAVVDAEVPPGSTKSVYLVDTNGDPNKEAWVQGLDRSARVSYVCMQRPQGNVSCALNEALGVICGGLSEPILEAGDGRQIVAVIGANQSIRNDFFTQLLPSLETHSLVMNPVAAQVNSKHRATSIEGPEVAQDRWTLPFMETWGCGGWSKANFIVDWKALERVGNFEHDVDTADYSLWVSFLKSGQAWTVRDECLASRSNVRTVGEIFADRKHWCKGQLQLFFSRKNPIACSTLSTQEKSSLLVPPWLQLISAVCTPLGLLVPILSIWFGIAPADFNNYFAIAFTVHYSASILAVYSGLNLDAVRTIFLAHMSDYAFWSVYFMAIVEIIGERLWRGAFFCCCCFGKQANKLQFQPLSTQESGDRSKSGYQREKSFALPGVHIGIVIVMMVLSISSAFAGTVLILTKHNSLPYLSYSLRASVLWCIFNTIPAIVLLDYLAIRKVGNRKMVGAFGMIGMILSASMMGSFIRYHRVTYNYGEVLTKSLLFYEAQRSGVLPEDNRIPWRMDSALKDVTVDGKSLVGGYYDAGDTVKFGLPLGVTLTMLSWSALEFQDDFEKTNEMENMRDAIKWGTDYILQCHTGKNEFYAQVGYGSEEHSMWGRPSELFANKVRVGQMLNETHPGSDILGSSAAALAAAHLVFKDIDESYAKRLLHHAKELYTFGKTFLGLSSDNLNDCQNFYHSMEYRDDLAMAAIWLYKATENLDYMFECEGHLDSMVIDAEGITPFFGWENVGAGVSVLLAQVSGDEKYIQEVDSHFRNWIFNMAYTPGGLAWLTKWGSLRFDANTAFLALIHAQHVMKHSVSPFHDMRVSTYRCWALFQIRYMLGDGGRSFVVGYGRNYPRYVHHRGASCPDYPEPCGWDDFNSPYPNPQIITGGLVGGPDQNGNYDDNRKNYVQNEVALDYNAGFTGAIAALVSLSEDTAFCYHGVGVFETLKMF